jgi:spermidine/putrescine transport system permease protein
MLMALPLVVPEIVIGSTLFLAFTTMYTFVPLGRTAQLLGHVTYNLSTVVIVVRARLLVLGPEYEEAAQDLGATPAQALRTILLPLLRPALLASSMVVFATSLDDFVVSQFLSADAGSETVPMKIYNSFRGTQTPAVNALATLMLAVSAVAVAIAALTLRSVHARGGTTSTVEELVAIEQ